MNLIFLRHGEATDNVKEIISDREIYFSVLTEAGIETVKESIKGLPDKIDKMYVSPFPRTIQTANLVYKHYPKCEVIIENRLHEIYHGKYTGLKNNEDLDNTRIRQIGGDYFVRFGQYGENKYEIEERLSNFLVDVYNNNMSDNTVLIVSHGSITSYMKRLLSIKSPHIQTGKMERFDDVDFSHLFKYIRKLKSIKNKCIKDRINIINNLSICDITKKNLIKLCKKEFNCIEFPDDYFNSLIDGFATNNLKQISDGHFDNGTILICFYNNSSNLIDLFMNHYISLGIKNYVLIDNNSTDNSTELYKKYSKKANISFWKITDKFNCNSMSGWKQRIMDYYGINRGYITVDADELLIYKDYKTIKFDEFVKKQKAKCLKTMMLDVYSKEGLYKGTLEDYKYVDKGTYKVSERKPYGVRFYGGPRSRMFGINPSLQKIPYMFYTGKETYVNDHYYYPFDVNNKALFCTYLLHYKFLPEDKEKYELFVKDERHWNNSSEYKAYNEVSKNDKNATFYDENISIRLEDIDYKF